MAVPAPVSCFFFLLSFNMNRFQEGYLSLSKLNNIRQPLLKSGIHGTEIHGESVHVSKSTTDPCDANSGPIDSASGMRAVVRAAASRGAVNQFQPATLGLRSTYLRVSLRSTGLGSFFESEHAAATARDT